MGHPEHEISFGGEVNILKLNCGDGQLCNFTTNYLIVRLKQVNFMVGKLYLKETVEKTQTRENQASSAWVPSYGI